MPKPRSRPAGAERDAEVAGVVVGAPVVDRQLAEPGPRRPLDDGQVSRSVVAALSCPVAQLGDVNVRRVPVNRWDSSSWAAWNASASSRASGRSTTRSPSMIGFWEKVLSLRNRPDRAGRRTDGSGVRPAARGRRGSRRRSARAWPGRCRRRPRARQRRRAGRRCPEVLVVEDDVGGHAVGLGPLRAPRPQRGLGLGGGAPQLGRRDRAAPGGRRRSTRSPKRTRSDAAASTVRTTHRPPSTSSIVPS